MRKLRVLDWANLILVAAILVVLALGFFASCA